MAAKQSIVLLFIAAAMVACASNGSVPSSGSSTSLTFVNGSRYAYRSSVYGVSKVAGSSSPAPLPTATSSDSILMTAPASFQGANGLVAVTYSVRVRTKHGFENLTSNDYFKAASAVGNNVLEHVGSGGESFRVRYTSPAEVLELPFHAGNRWDPSASYRLKSKTDDEMWNKDGSYVSNYETFSQIGSSPPTILHAHTVVRSDGSALLVQRAGGGCKPVTIRIGVPVNRGGTYYIPYELSQPGNTCHGPVILTKTMGIDWYPGGKLPPAPLQRASVTEEGLTAIPSACNVPASVGMSAEKIVRIGTTLNPFGAISQSTDTEYYTTRLGLVCTVSQATVSFYGVISPQGLLETATTNGTRSMQSFSSGAGAALPSDGIGNELVWGVRARACLAFALIERSRTGGGSSVPAQCRS
jgi:hypothetical protein